MRVRASSASSPAAPSQVLFRFGIIADVQYADVEDAWDYKHTERRQYAASILGLRKAVQYWNEKTPDIRFIAQLGDIIDGQNAGKYGQGLKFKDNPQSEPALQAVLAELAQCCCKNVMHAIGNHELYNFNREELAAKLQTQRGGKEYYSEVIIPGWRVIMLDAYDLAIIGRNPGSPEYEESMTLLKKYNKNDLLSQGTVNWFEGLDGMKKRFVPFNGGLSKPQMDWLEQTLTQAKQANEKVIILNHLPILPEAGNERTMLWNYDEVLALLDRVGKGTVVAVFGGHSHAFGYGVDSAGIHHIILDTPLTTADQGFTYGHVEVCEDRLIMVGQGNLPSKTMMFPSSSS